MVGLSASAPLRPTGGSASSRWWGPGEVSGDRPPRHLRPARAPRGCGGSGRGLPCQAVRRSLAPSGRRPGRGTPAPSRRPRTGRDASCGRPVPHPPRMLSGSSGGVTSTARRTAGSRRPGATGQVREMRAEFGVGRSISFKAGSLSTSEPADGSEAKSLPPAAITYPYEADGRNPRGLLQSRGVPYGRRLRAHRVLPLGPAQRA